MRSVGSSQVVEFFISLFVGVLAVLGAVLIVSFLLVEPVRNPPGHTAILLDIEELTKSCSPLFHTKLLESGCTTAHKESTVEQAWCTNRECDCDEDHQGSVCCCRSLREETFDNLICPAGVAVPLVKNETVCGCAVCDDLTVQVHITIVNRDTDDPIPAALILRNEGVEAFTLLGITNNNGHYLFNEPVASLNLTLKIVASGFVPQFTDPVRLSPHQKVVQLRIVMIPHMSVKLGLGGSALTLRLGPMAAITASAGAFKSMEGETYEDEVSFNGIFLTPDDPNEFTGVPSSGFSVMNHDTAEMEQMAVFFVTRLEFMDVEGEKLTANDLQLQVFLHNEDGKLGDPDHQLCLLIYNETSLQWEKFANFKASPDARGKRQTSQVVVFESLRIPTIVFAAVASSFNIDCWFQGRTFDLDGAPTSGPIIALEQYVVMSGNNAMFRFGTNTGAQSGELVTNALCIPTHCGPFSSATVSSREAIQRFSMSLATVPFPPATFDGRDNAPLEIGTLFTFNELILSSSSRPSPFYATQDECVASAKEESASFSEYFRFKEVSETMRPTADVDSCYLKVAILGCFPNNTVEVTSINETDGAFISRIGTPVHEREDDMDMDEMGSGTMEPPTPSGMCNDTTATVRVACIAFVCGSRIVIRVNSNVENTMGGFCTVTDLSVVAKNELLTSTNPNSLTLKSQKLVADNYNDPALGLYFEPGHTAMAAMRAESLCNAGDGVSTSDAINATSGVAFTFSCF